MKQQFLRALLIIISWCALVSFFKIWVNYYSDYTSTKEENARLKIELAHTTIPMRVDTIRDSVPVIKQKIVTIDKTDYKKEVADRQLIEDLKLRVSEVESENRTLIATMDSVRLIVQKGDSIHTYHDKWADFNYNSKSFLLEYQVRDSIATIVSRIPKHKFLWWRWGTKGYDVNIVNFNPHATVKYNKYIKVE